VRLVRNERGELVCAGCGFVVDEYFLVDTGPDWRAEQQEKRHTGPPISGTIHDYGISSRIDRRDRDVLGRQLTPARAAAFRRLRKLDQRAHVTNSERTLTRAFQEQARVCHNLGLPNYVRERAATLFRKVAKERTLRGRPIEATAAAAIYLTCKEFGLERDLDELARESGIDPGDLKRAYSALVRVFGLRLSPIEPAYYVLDIAEGLGLKESERNRILELIGRKKRISERDAIRTVASAVFAACGERRKGLSKKKIADAINLSRASFSKFIKRGLE
jgi:transcription initiation factor TFIIB